MIEMKIGISKYNKWYKYLKPKRISYDYPIYQWLCFECRLDKEEYQKKVVSKGKRYSFIYCPKCDADLIENNSFTEDTDYVYYRCTNCGTESIWDFDVPCPILVSTNYKEGEDNNVQVKR